MPEYVWLWYDKLPRNESGKVLKKELRKMLAGRAEQQQRDGSFRLLTPRAKM